MLRVEPERLIAAGDRTFMLPEVRESVALPLPGRRIFGICGKRPVKTGGSLVVAAGLDERKPLPLPENRIVGREFKCLIVTDDRIVETAGGAESLTSVIPSSGILISSRHRNLRGNQTHKNVT
ncbi:hypothetical protein EI28_01905 [Methanoculleus sp. MH98A]|nr:hypothetical protein EI28_01905 [Methanoculleus sp. MH98A]